MLSFSKMLMITCRYAYHIPNTNIVYTTTTGDYKVLRRRIVPWDNYHMCSWRCQQLFIVIFTKGKIPNFWNICYMSVKYNMKLVFFFVNCTFRYYFRPRKMYNFLLSDLFFDLLFFIMVQIRSTLRLLMIIMVVDHTNK